MVGSYDVCHVYVSKFSNREMIGAQSPGMVWSNWFYMNMINSKVRLQYIAQTCLGLLAVSFAR